MNKFFILRRTLNEQNDMQTRSVQAASGNGYKEQMIALFLIIFDMVSAGLLMAIVFYDVWRLRRKSASIRIHNRSPPNFFQCIQPGEVVSLAFATAVLAQGVLFLVVQCMDLQSPVSQNCRAVSQIVFPAMWLVGLVVLVFGFETLYRAFQRRRFASRGRWNVCICWTSILILLVLLWIPTRVRSSMTDTCPSALLFFVMPWADIAFGITIGIVVLSVLIALALTTQLLRTPVVNRAERLAASQMVYYLGITAVIFVLILPLWARISFNSPPGFTFMMALVSMNIIGMTVSLFQLVFRSDGEEMSIRPPKSWQCCKSFRLSTFNLNNHISSRGVVDEDLVSHILNNPLEISEYDPVYDNARSPETPNLKKPVTPTPIITSSSDNAPAPRRTRYSPFPTKVSINQSQYLRPSLDEEPLPLPPRLPTSIYRDSFDTNHTTVQIGLRLSNRVLTSGIRSSNSGPALPLSPQDIPPEPHYGKAIGHLSATSLEVPVTLRSSATENINQNGFSYPIKPLRLKKNILSPRTAQSEQLSPVMNFSRLPSSVYQEQTPPKKSLNLDTNGEELPTGSGSSSPWPLRDSQTILLSSKVYDPEKDNWI
ncbi:hypothetical protein BGW36DRAFT_433668 [Talaromyces proteolyticus]|uniref:Uncharacterized protein n=1 Tax=Talaromyces proteolyticus TaxID=1131652 RepID=A0AAD4KGB0_9EURO|nr:uncharacterized protein BGW36DRAFT_433668 [Talaromyces proteolyticus]KAH8689666.1 hypothetical protein BGW36DRAFT_433668 [Talaromyces proteolyticus]